jgi:hypothetical protein
LHRYVGPYNFPFFGLLEDIRVYDRGLVASQVPPNFTGGIAVRGLSHEASVRGMHVIGAFWPSM